jgi:uncharacterized protein YuzE
MNNKMKIYYDEEGDFLEIMTGEKGEGYFKNLGDGIFQRINKKTGNITGIAIMSFKKRTQGLKEVKVKLPMGIQLTP